MDDPDSRGCRRGMNTFCPVLACDTCVGIVSIPFSTIPCSIGSCNSSSTQASPLRTWPSTGSTSLDGDHHAAAKFDADHLGPSSTTI